MGSLIPGFQETRVRQCVKLDALFRDRANLPAGYCADEVCDNSRMIVDPLLNPLCLPIESCVPRRPAAV
jgi:hypothetical protein